jgi:hypothetical protein
MTVSGKRSADLLLAAYGSQLTEKRLCLEEELQEKEKFYRIRYTTASW